MYSSLMFLCGTHKLLTRHSRHSDTKVTATSYLSVVQPAVVVVVQFSTQLCDDICFIQLLQDRLCVIQIGYLWEGGGKEKVKEGEEWQDRGSKGGSKGGRKGGRRKEERSEKRHFLVTCSVTYCRA